jgi:hypothetical protein
MASLRLSTTLRNCARNFCLSRNYTVAVTNPILPRRASLKSSTPRFAKANASTAATNGIDSVENGTNTTNAPSPNESANGNQFKDGNGNGLSSINPGNGNGNGISELHNDWSKSYHGLASVAFPKDVADILQAPVDPLDIEMKPGEFVFHCD